MLVFPVYGYDVRGFLLPSFQIIARYGILSSITVLQVITKVHTLLWCGLLLTDVLLSFRSSISIRKLCANKVLLISFWCHWKKRRHFLGNGYRHFYLYRISFLFLIFILYSFTLLNTPVDRVSFINESNILTPPMLQSICL